MVVFCEKKARRGILLLWIVFPFCYSLSLLSNFFLFVYVSCKYCKMYNVDVIIMTNVELLRIFL